MSFPLVTGYDILERIGLGSFSIVFKAVPKNNSKKLVAIKCIDKQCQKKSFADNIVKEISFLKMLKHEYIVQLKDFLWDSKHIFIIMEYCNEGDLAKYIRNRHKLRESLVKIFMQHLAMALMFLRQNNICHMDLKPQNLLLCSKPALTLKVGDFGLSQYLTMEGSEQCRFAGSPLYMAPEKLLHRKFDGRVDLWSVGIIMYECLFGRPPYTTLNTNILNLMTKQVPIELPKHANISKNCEDLLGRLLKHNVEERIDFDLFFTHTFLDLDHMATTHNYKKAHDIIQEAVKFDQEGKYQNSLPLYEEAVKFLEPLTSAENNIGNKALIKLRLKEYEQWIKALKNHLKSKNPLPNSKPSPLIEVDYESLYSLSISTPNLSAALEIGRIGELYFVEMQYTLALEKLKSALNILMPALQNEPAGLRRTLLHTQVEAWLTLAENLQKQ